MTMHCDVTHHSSRRLTAQVSAASKPRSCSFSFPEALFALGIFGLEKKLVCNTDVSWGINESHIDNR